MSAENIKNEITEKADPPQKVTLGAHYFVNPSFVLKLPPFHGRSVWDVSLINTLRTHDSAMNHFATRRKHYMSISNAARKSYSAVQAPSREEKDARERKHFSALIVNAVNKFWACVQSHLDATKEVQLKDQRKKELHEKQISSLEYTEKLLKKRIKFQLGEGDLPPLRLLEHIGTGLRVYQRVGVEWLMSLHDQGICGILADEMGLGKTVQTIAFFTYLAEHRQDWGTHLIVVPMSIVLNWEAEFRRWAPAFNVLTYYGSVKERAEKRKGWDSNVHYNAVIVSYNTLLKDKRIFRRRKWHYLVLDEAHAIKSWETQRWQVLLDFQTEHRLLLSGTPLQNNPMELWSLLHFLMPESIVFESHEDFKALYGNPVVSLDVVHRLHQTLRPFVLRRLKCDVEKQLPKKVEKILLCPLSKRQRALYDEYIALEETRKILASKDTLSILGVLIALRKVCNHPDLFQERPTESPFVIQKSIATRWAQSIPENLWLTMTNSTIANWNSSGSVRHDPFALDSLRRGLSQMVPVEKLSSPSVEPSLPESLSKYAQQLHTAEEKESMLRIENLNRRHRRAVRDAVSWSVFPLLSVNHQRKTPLSNRLKCPKETPHMPPRCTTMKCLALDTRSQLNGIFQQDTFLEKATQNTITQFHLAQCVTHPHRRMLQYDSGKLQTLAQLLPKLRHEGHRCLIFTQFTKVLNILEKFLTANALTYFRLDGSTPIRKRQHYVDTFNRTDRIFAFILSTRSGGLGLNLVGADTVIFYDSDWNPAIDVQAQDRCHRIGQMRDVTIYRLVSEFTVEEKILLRAREKKRMNNIVMRAGGFETLSVDRLASEPDAQWKDSVLDFFHDLDEDYNSGKGSTSRLEQLENCLQKVEDDENALVEESTKMEDPDREETIVQFGIGLKRAISRFTDDNVRIPQAKDPECVTDDQPVTIPVKLHRIFFLRSAKDIKRGRLHALCMRLGAVILVAGVPTKSEESWWFIEFQDSIHIAALVSLMLRQNYIDNGQHVCLSPPENTDWHVMDASCHSPGKQEKSVEVSSLRSTDPCALDDALEKTSDREGMIVHECEKLIIPEIVPQSEKYVYVIHPAKSFSVDTIERKLQSLGIERVINCHEWTDHRKQRVIRIELPSVQETMRTLYLQVLIGDSGCTSPLLSHDGFISHQRLRRNKPSVWFRQSQSSHRKRKRRRDFKKSWRSIN